MPTNTKTSSEIRLHPAALWEERGQNTHVTATWDPGRPAAGTLPVLAVQLDLLTPPGPQRHKPLPTRVPLLTARGKSNGTFPHKQPGSHTLGVTSTVDRHRLRAGPQL